MTELFQYYFDGFKYVYLKNIPKETIASKSLIFGSMLNNYYLFYNNPNTKNSVYGPLYKMCDVLKCITTLNIVYSKTENGNNELSVFDSLELYSIIQNILKEGIVYGDILKRFVEQKHKEHINVPLELINDMIYKKSIDFKFPVDISENIKTYLHKKSIYDKICVAIDYDLDNDLSYISDNRYHSTLSSVAIKRLINNEFCKCNNCNKYYDPSCIQNDNSCLCYYCYYKIYNTYPDGRNLLNNLIDKIHFDDHTFIEIIKDAFVRHFVAYFDIEDDLKKYDYNELIKNKDFLNKIYNLNLYKELFLNLLKDSINGEYNDYTLMLIEDYNEM